jgi:hypothetical protein
MNRLVLIWMKSNFPKIAYSQEIAERHGHGKIDFDAPEAYFHNFATHNIAGSPFQSPGYQHCASNGKHQYQLKHFGNRHGINRKYAMGHDRNRSGVWFEFSREIQPGWWDVSSGRKTTKSQVPD